MIVKASCHRVVMSDSFICSITSIDDPMEKLDLTKTYKSYYTAKAKPEIVAVESAQYLSVTGKGAPAGKIFAQKIQALFSTAYAIKFKFKALDKDFIVPKLECLWWFDEQAYGRLSIAEAPLSVPRSEWEYRLLLRMPDYVTQQKVEGGIQNTFAKKQLPFVKDIELYKMNEGKCVQVLHIGSFASEPDTLNRLGRFMQSQQLTKNGFHHEIYLSDFNKVPADKLKTILREPVR